MYVHIYTVRLVKNLLHNFSILKLQYLSWQRHKQRDAFVFSNFQLMLFCIVFCLASALICAQGVLPVAVPATYHRFFSRFLFLNSNKLLAPLPTPLLPQLKWTPRSFSHSSTSSIQINSSLLFPLLYFLNSSFHFLNYHCPSTPPNPALFSPILYQLLQFVPHSSTSRPHTLLPTPTPRLPLLASKPHISTTSWTPLPSTYPLLHF